jgi:BNR repeat protein
VVYQGEEPALFPGLTRAANGDLLVSFCTRFDCLSGGEGYLLRSSDEGRTWSSPTLILRPRHPAGCINLSVGLTTLRNGTVLYPCCEARITRKWDQHEADLLILRSEDHGDTWTVPEPIRVGVKEPFAYGRIVELSSGVLLCPIWGKQTGDEPWRSGLVRSSDGGRTWGEHVTIAYDAEAAPLLGPTTPAEIHCAGFNETSLLELPDGRILALLRQQGVQGRRRDLYHAISSDGGRNWSPPRCLPLWGTSPSLHLTSSGDLLLGYRNHLGNPQGLTSPGVGLSFLSVDDGETWSRHILLEDPQAYRYRQEFDAGYPAFLNLSDGAVLAVFYSYDPLLPAGRYLAANILR